MEQNNFEKNVRQKMDELKISPSESVWTNVEKRIREKEKDRKAIFIFFFLFLLIFYGSYRLLNSSKNNDKKNEQTSTITRKGNDSKAINKRDSSFQKSTLKSLNEPANINVASTSGIKIKKPEPASRKKINKKNKNKQRKSTTDESPEVKENYSKRTNNEDSGIVFTNKMSVTENQSDSNKIKNNIENKTSIDSISDPLKREITTDKLIAKKDSVAEKSLKNLKKNQWHLGITLSAGTSLISNNILKRNYGIANYNAAFPSGNSGYYYSPSPIKNSAAFIAGAFIEKNISHKTKISLGISYKYFSLNNKVGNKIDSSGQLLYSLSDNIYSSGINLKTYHNNFHFFELPVSVKVQLNNKSKHPVFWNAGINISQLISTNALQFQPNPGLYYEDNSVFNKTEFGLSTGFSLMLFSQQKMPFSFGPYFSYSPTSLAKKGLYNSKHFSFIGINIKILFQKK